MLQLRNQAAGFDNKTRVATTTWSMNMITKAKNAKPPKKGVLVCSITPINAAKIKGVLITSFRDSVNVQNISDIVLANSMHIINNHILQSPDQGRLLNIIELLVLYVREAAVDGALKGNYKKETSALFRIRCACFYKRTAVQLEGGVTL